MSEDNEHPITELQAGDSHAGGKEQRKGKAGEVGASENGEGALSPKMRKQASQGNSGSPVPDWQQSRGVICKLIKFKRVRKRVSSPGPEGAGSKETASQRHHTRWGGPIAMTRGA